MSNPHFDATKGWLEYSAEQNPDNDGRAMHAAALAQTKALLAIAYELKTANLLATLNLPTGNISDWTPEMIDDHNKRLKDIATRLGLGETK